MSVIDISGLSKAEVLAALFNASSPAGLGFVAATAAPEDMTVAKAEEVLTHQTKFDYLGGRSFKIDLDSNSFDPRLYDRDNGGDGTAEKIIQRLRDTGSVSSAEYAANRDAVTTQRVHEQPGYAEVGELLGGLVGESMRLWAEIAADGLPEPREDMTPREHLHWASDQALRYYDRGEKEKAVMLFLHLVQLNEHTAWIASHTATPMLMQVGLMGDRYNMERQMKGFAA